METKMECRVGLISLCLWKACAVSRETYMPGAEGERGRKAPDLPDRVWGYTSPGG